MSNSEVSVATSPAEALAASETYVYPSSWDGTSSRAFQTNSKVKSDSSNCGIAEVEGTTQSSDVSAGSAQAHAPKVRSWEPASTDYGLWLLHGYSTRQQYWARLRCVPQAGVHRDIRYSPELVKRTCDVAGSLLLLVALFPLFVFIAAVIKIDSEGPVFFHHDRVGKGGRHFVLWKFRSMRMDVSKYETSPQSTVDPRLTRVGRWIRRMSIDEIPQLINVLTGDMSLVGPRPEMPFLVEQYHSIESERLAARPGITGLWQISPARAFPIHENLQYDLHYVRNQNIVLDCAIILRTITAVIHGVGAV